MAEHELALLVLCAFYVNLNLVTYLEVRVVTELRYRDDTFALAADGYDNFALVD